MIFNIPNTREGRQALLRAYGSPLANSARYLDNPNEFRSLVEDDSRSISQFFVEKGLGRALGQFLNVYNSPKASDKEKKAALDIFTQQSTEGNSTLQSIFGTLSKLQKGGFLNQEGIDQYNSVATAVKKYVPNVKVAFLEGGKNPISEESFVTAVTGADSKGNKPTKQVTPNNVQASSTGVPMVDSLVDKVLTTPNQNTANLQQYDWWKSASLQDKEAAFAQIKKITSSPQEMSNYVLSKNLQNLQQYDWWASSPFKKDAWGLIEQAVAKGAPDGSPITAPQGDPGVSDAGDGSWLGDGNRGGTPTTPTTPTGTAPSGTSDEAYQRALQDLENNPDFQALPRGLQDLYRTALKNYDYNKEVNIQGVLDEFERIKTQTIDPRFSKEIEKFTGDLQSQINFQAQEREMALEAERAQAGQSIRQAREGLAKSGMTFTGKAIEELGAESAYAQPGQDSAIPNQTSFGGLFYEGNVNQANRLMSSSSALRYKRNLELLGQNAEEALGAKGAIGLNIPGFTPSGNLPGAFEDRRQSELGGALGELLNQNYKNMEQRNDLQYNQ